jgi:hypothetical protein
MRERKGGASTVNGISEPVPGPHGGPFRRLEWDVAAGYAMVYMADGTTASMPVRRPMAGEDAGIARVVCSFADHEVTLTTPGGECATMEIEPPGGTPQRAARRVVYLDQGHWNTLTRRIREPGSIARQDGVAADKIIGWARDRRVILPLSSGHVIETTPLYGGKRRRQALAMLDLSRGWHMRNPVHVRYDEIADVLSSASAGALRHGRPDVFTLDPGSIYATTTAAGPPAPAGPAHYLVWLGERLTTIMAGFDLLTDPQPIPSEKATGWCDQLAATGRNAEFRKLPAGRRRDAARILALDDAIADAPVTALIQRSGLPPDRVADTLVQGLRERTDTMPFLRLYADALGVRLLNPTTRWVPNDLVDMLYLACAAAYADGVAAERAAAQYLGTAWQGRPAACPVARTLGGLVSYLTDLGVD